MDVGAHSWRRLYIYKYISTNVRNLLQEAHHPKIAGNRRQNHPNKSIPRRRVRSRDAAKNQKSEVETSKALATTSLRQKSCNV